ncbi:MAG: hypothetical protein ACK4RZ_05480 [Paracoccaceae bacterium]
MSTAKKLKKLHRIAQLLRDRDLSNLAGTSVRKSRTEVLLSALDTTQSAPSLDPVSAGQVVDRFGLWTTNRRIVLNQQLARETVEWMAAYTSAQRSFGRAEVLQKLKGRR